MRVEGDPDAEITVDQTLVAGVAVGSASILITPSRRGFAPERVFGYCIEVGVSGVEPK